MKISQPAITFILLALATAAFCAPPVPTPILLGKDRSAPAPVSAPPAQKKPVPKPPRWSVWAGGGSSGILSPRRARTIMDGGTSWQAGFLYGFKTRWRLGISYADLALKGPYRGQAGYISGTYLFQTGETWTPFASYGAGIGRTPGSDSFGKGTSRAGVGVESKLTRHISWRAEGNYFHFPKGGSAETEVHAMTTGLFLSWRFDAPKIEPQIDKSTGTVDEVPEEEEISSEETEGVDQAALENSTMTAKGDAKGGTASATETEEEETAAAKPAGPPDADRDGVPDAADACADTLKGIPVDSTGCPKKLEKKVRIVLNVHFDTNRHVVKKAYHAHLKKVADFLKAYPDVKAFIEGHADNRGPVKYTQRLSKKRADSIRAYLIMKFNIDPTRLTTKGHGSAKPVASNATKEGRKKNRRVTATLTAIKR
jgi:OmpA-OmpF porin, OOP family